MTNRDRLLTGQVAHGLPLARWRQFFSCFSGKFSSPVTAFSQMMVPWAL